MSASTAALLTTLPVLCFGGLAPLAPRLARRFSLEGVLLGCAVLTVLAAAARGLSGVGALFAGSLLAGAAVAVGQVALPAFIRAGHAHATGRLIGAYSMALPIGATVGAAAAVPLAVAWGGSWRLSLAFWALPALLAALAWSRMGGATHDEPFQAGRGRALPPRAWALVAFFGLQSMAFYGGLAWLPESRQASGWSAASAGALQALANLVSAAPAFAIPLLAARGWSATWLLVSVVALAAGGALGLLASAEAAPLWIIVLGLGQGGLLGLGLILPTLNAADAREVAQLTAATMFGGYIIAAFGPTALGLAQEMSGGWAAPLLVLVAMTVASLLAGLPAARKRS